MPEKIIGLTLILDFFDRGHSLASLYLPLAALGSLPLPAYRRPMGGKRTDCHTSVRTGSQ